MDPFKKGVYDELKANCQHVLGVSSDRFREVLLERGHDIFRNLRRPTNSLGLLSCDRV